MSTKIVIKQQDIKDCGAACLLSIIKYYEGNISLEKIKIDTCIDKSGISAYNLIAAAKKYGFDAKGIKLSFDDLIKSQVVLPLIAYLQLENGLRHYVVIYKITKKHLLIMDPAKGLKKVSHQEFKNIYKDVVIELSPVSNIVNYTQDNKLLDMFLNIIKNNKKLIINMFITSVLLTIISILSSFYIKVIINNSDNNTKSLFYLLVIVFLLLTFLKIIFMYLRSYYESFLNKNIDVSLMPSFIKHIFNLPLNAISNRSTGEITTRVSELNNIKELFANMFVTLVLNLLLAISSCFVLMFINAKLTIVLLIVLSLYLINNLMWIKPINNYVEDNINLQTMFSSNLTNNLNSFISIKNHPSFCLEKINNSLIKYLSNTFKLQNKINNYNFLNNFIIEIGLFILNTYGLILVINNIIELIDLITYNSLYLYFIEPIKEIINLIPKYVFIKRSFIKINDFMLLESEEKKSNLEKFFVGDISFDNIDFSYNMYDYPIKKFSLKINKNNKVLVMGTSGLGKSTLFKLLFRLYKPLKGNIKINDINIYDYNLRTIRENICYVSQDETIYNDTILNNITLGKTIEKEKLNKILDICRVNDILDKKAFRLDTYVVENLSNLSNGERSRIIMARALVKNSPIIIFDETFSSVEENDANKMIKDIFSYYKEKTIILISHFKPDYKFDQIINGGFNNEL